MITFKNIALGYSDKSLIEGVSFVVNPGECVGIMGANGSGKSTFLRMVAGQKKPTVGAISGVHSLYYVRQTPQLFARLTVAQHARLGGVSAEDLSKWGILEQANHLPAELSYGQKRLLTLLLADASGAQILLLDEICAGIAKKTKEEIVNIIEKWKKERKIIMMVEHNKSILYPVCDRLYMIKNKELTMIKTC